MDSNNHVDHAGRLRHPLVELEQDQEIEGGRLPLPEEEEPKITGGRLPNPPETDERCYG